MSAVLVVEESGDLKKGSRTVAEQRQYTGTADAGAPSRPGSGPC
jgi:SRSO17 transposase